jgi:hypothetical protein
MTKSDLAFTWMLLGAILVHVNDNMFMKIVWGVFTAGALLLSIAERRK